MLWTIVVILLLLALIGGYGVNSWIYLLAVVALVVLVINLVTGRRGV